MSNQVVTMQCFNCGHEYEVLAGTFQHCPKCNPDKGVPEMDAGGRICPYCGDDDHSLVKRIVGGVVAVCCTCGRHFEIMDND